MHVQRRKMWLTPTAGVPCSNAANTRNPLKLPGVPQTTEPILAAIRPKFVILWDMWRRYCCLTSFFSIVDTCLSCEDIARQSCAMVPEWRFLRPVFCSEPRAARFRPASYKKCNALVLSNKKEKPSLKLTVCDKQLSIVDTVKDLGVIMDSQ